MTNYDEENSVDTTPVGTVYVTGSSVDKGQVDLEKTVQYLKGLEKALKFFIAKTSPEIAQSSYSIEVRIRPGSLVTGHYHNWVLGGGYWCSYRRSWGLCKNSGRANGKKRCGRKNN